MQRSLAGLFAFLVITASTVPALPAEPNGASGRVTLSVQASTPQMHLSVTGDAAFERRGSMFRLDLSRLSLTAGENGREPRNPLPPGGYTVVYDTATSTYTVWSPSRRRYYSGRVRPFAGTPSGRPTPTPSATPGTRSNGLASFLSSLKDLRQFQMSVSLSADKTPIEGHPTTNFDLRFIRQVKTDEPVEMTGRLSFADDLGGIPLLLSFNVTNGTPGTRSVNLRAALTGVQQKTPPQTDFAPPAGFVKVSSILDVITLPKGP